MSGGEGKKVRSDKKIDVRPTVSDLLKSDLYTFSHLCNQPVKDTIEQLCIEALKTKVIIDQLSKWFRRSYKYHQTLVLGHEERPRLKITYNGERSKVTTRLIRKDYDRLCELAYALDVTPTSAAGILIKITLENHEFLSEFIQRFEGEQLSKLEKYINMKG